jgi:hypothetical protein
MDVKFQVSKPANLFHVVDNTSLWDEAHCRANIRKWYEELFGLSAEDEMLLEKYATIRKKYGWKKLDSDFIPSRNYRQALSKARKRLKPSDFNALYEVIKHFSDNAGEMYSDTRPKLIRRKSNLEIEVQNHELNKLFEDVASFYGVKYYPKQFTAHLLLNASDGSVGGGANVEPRVHVTVEPLYLGEEKTEYLLTDIGSLSHEALHLIEDCTDIYDLEKYVGLTRRKGIRGFEEEILREAIAETLVPWGFLSVKYGLMNEPKILRCMDIPIKPPIDKKDYRQYRIDFRHKLAAHLYELTLKTLEKENSIFDGNYLETAIDILIALRPYST